MMDKLTNPAGADILAERIEKLIEEARKHVVTQVNSAMVYTYYEIGRMIVQDEQEGEARATYGKGILKTLSRRLTAKFGKGFSVESLDRMRYFYRVYSSKSSSLLTNSECGSKEPNLPGVFVLSWSHYLFLMRIENEQERQFYELEASNNHWSLRELRRQFDSALYERIALSTNKAQVFALSQKGQIVTKPSDAVKDPYVLEFLGIPEKAEYSENDLETRIIDHLQEFLMEMGKGFTFVGRQMRFTFDEEHFRVDLVLYNRLLRCFVLIDLKIGKLKHQDLGQMQMYVNYYDRYEKTAEENPTIGILLCNDKSDRMVELTLPKDSNIYASKYQLYLPDKKILQEKLIEWLEEEDEHHE